MRRELGAISGICGRRLVNCANLSVVQVQTRSFGQNRLCVSEQIYRHFVLPVALRPGRLALLPIIMPITPIKFGDQSQKLWKQSAPLWLIDVARARIVWANQACLEFSGARSLDDLTRLRFDVHSPFIGQLASLILRKDDKEGVRELLRFPSPKGVFIMDCLCRHGQIDERQAGVLVELIADRGLTVEKDLVPLQEQEQEQELRDSGPETEMPQGRPLANNRTKANEKLPVEHQNGVLPNSEVPRASHLQNQPPHQQKTSSAPSAVLHFDKVNGANGFEIDADSVEEEDLQTLREIARLINGPGLLMENSQEEMDVRPAIATRGQPFSSDRDMSPTDQQPNSLLSENGAARECVDVSVSARVKEPVKEPAPAPMPVSASMASREPEPAPPVFSAGNGAAKSVPGRGERNYFLESLPVALAIAMGGRLMRANETFLYAFGFSSESELRRAGGLAALFPQSAKGVLQVADSPNGGVPPGHRSARSGQVKTKTVSRSGRERTIPIAYRNVSTGQDAVQILILHEDALGCDGGYNGAGDDQKKRVNPSVSGKAMNEPPGRSPGQDSIDFLANVSHEVRTPLNSIIGFSELMKDERFGAVDAHKFREYAGDIHSSAMHALSVINDLLDITKIIAGKSDLEFEAVSINKLVTQMISVMRTQASDQDINLKTDLQAGLPALMADPRSLNQIFLNLLSNAIKFTAKGGEVSVSSRQLEEGGILLSVKDTGIGMSAEQLEKALEPFEQVETVSPSKGFELPYAQKGTGLGLPLTKALVQGNQARFSIRSTPGVGTCIDIYFPLERLAGELAVQHQ